MSTHAIRAGRDDDWWELVALIGACWAEYPGCIMDVHGECPELLAPARSYAAIGGAFWVATDAAGLVVASVAVRPLPDGVVDLERLYVAPRARRQGLAGRLVEQVEAWGGEREADRVELWSDSRFVDAHGLYRKQGYAASGRTRSLHDRSQTVEHHFARALPQA